MIKGLIGPEGWESQVSRYVPPNVFALLKKKYKTLTEEMRRAAANRKIPCGLPPSLAENFPGKSAVPFPPSARGKSLEP